MKSNKQRRKEIKEKRLQKAQKQLKKVDVYTSNIMPDSAIVANHEILELYNESPFPLFPKFYIDRPFICRDCGSHEIWTAKQQKWWYEIAGGRLEQIAIRCRSCRKKEQERKAIARKIHLDGIKNKKSN